MKLVNSGHTVLHLCHEFFCYKRVFTQPIELQKTLDRGGFNGQFNFNFNLQCKITKRMDSKKHLAFVISTLVAFKI